MPKTDPRVTLVDHPLVQHKLSYLRSADSGTGMFRQLVEEIATLETFEATRAFELVDVPVTTPLVDTTCRRLARGVTVVPILRAGIGMMGGVLQVIPQASVGFIGMQRNEQTHRPEPYYQKLPKDIGDNDVLLVDPMLATGGSGAAAIRYLREAGAKRLALMVLVAAPEGIQTILDADPDIHIYTCAIDERLNEQAYIVPGLGDAGDRTFGTL